MPIFKRSMYIWWVAFMIAAVQPATGIQPDRWKVVAVN
jgi:hypothetical protein